jgi:DNA-binding MarR family transcriptional regulator
VSREDTAARLRFVISRATRRLRQRAGDELTPSQSAVIDTIAQHGPLTPSAVADHEQVSRPAVTRIVSKLSDRGLLSREDDKSDGRSYLLSISSEGAALRASRRGRKNAYLAQLLERASDEDVRLLADAADVLWALLEQDGG